MMCKRDRTAISVIALSLMMLGIANFANTAVALELQLARRYVYLTTLSWAIVWLAGVVLIIVAAANMDDH
jgi:hypothetical protein